MKLVSHTLCVILGAALSLIAADSPKTPSPPQPAGPTVSAPREKPLVLTLEDPATSGAVKAAAPAASPANPSLQFTPGAPLITTTAVPSGFLVAPAATENTGPTITINDKNAPLAPGVYVASPYTGIVVIPVPGDSGIIKPE